MKTPEQIAQVEWPFSECVTRGVTLDGTKIRESFASALRAYADEKLEEVARIFESTMEGKSPVAEMIRSRKSKEPQPS